MAIPNETPDADSSAGGMRDIPQSLSSLSPEARQQVFDVQAELSSDIVSARESGSTLAAEPIPELENKQWAFERSEVAQDIQRTNDMPAPGE